MQFGDQTRPRRWMKSNSMMRTTIAALSCVLMFILAPPSVAKEQQFIGTSVQALAGFYRATNGFAAITGESVGIGPDGKVTLNARGGTYENRFLNGKITYFSQAGFVVTFTGMKGPIEMRFLFLRKYPLSFFQ